MRKVCTKCRQEKPISEYHKSKNTKDGYRYWCKKCCFEYNREYQKTPNGIYQLIKGRQTFNHKHGISAAKPFNLKKDEFLTWYDKQRKVCVYCHIPEECIYLMRKKWGDITERLTVDCRDDSVGYRIDNIVLCCPKCNLVKQNILTYKEMLYVGENFIQPKWEELKLYDDFINVRSYGPVGHLSFYGKGKLNGSMKNEI